MRNNNYKKAFNQLNISDESLSSLYDITTQKKHKSSSLTKKILATALAFILVIGSAFGFSYSISDKTSVGIYVANANEVANIKKATKQDFTYQVYIGKNNKDALSKWQTDKQKLLNEAEKLGDNDYSASVRSGSSAAVNKQGEEIDFYTLSSGNFAVNVGDVKDVKKLIIENKNKYTELSVEIYDEDTEDWYTDGRKVEISADKLQKSYDSKMCSFSNGMFKKDINFGNSFTWDLTYLSSYISETDKFNYNDLNDTVIATIEYNDGTVIKRGFDIKFNNNGVGHISEIDIK